MKASWLWTVLFAVFTAIPALAADELENGGTAILHASYTVNRVQGSCNTLVIVTSIEEIQRIMEVIRTEPKISFFALENSETLYRLRPIAKNRLMGREVGSRRCVLVVDHAYAEANGYF